MRWSHDCLKSKPNNKRPNLTDVPLELEKEESGEPPEEAKDAKPVKERPASPSPSPPREILREEPQPTLSELKLAARMERQARFAPNMFD